MKTQQTIESTYLCVFHWCWHWLLSITAVPGSPVDRHLSRTVARGSRLSGVAGSWLAAAIVAAPWIWASSALSQPCSTFDLNAEGWMAIERNGANVTVLGPAQWHAAGGVPGGFIDAADVNWDLHLRAPAAFLGDKSAWCGSCLSFNIISDLNGAVVAMPDNVVLQSGTITIAYTAAPPVTQKDFWYTWTIPLMDDPGWHYYGATTPLPAGLVCQVLSNLTALDILVEYASGPDTGGIDNVCIGCPEPCPGSLLVNGHFNGFVPMNGAGNGWTASFNTGSWTATLGNPAPSYWLNNSRLPTDPTLTQVVTGLTVGKCYTLSGEFASLINNAKPAGADSFAVSINNVIVFKGKPGPLLQWQTITAPPFTATAPTATIRLMAEWNGTDNDFLVDNICLVPCPLPDCTMPPPNMALWLPFDQVWGNPPRTRNIIPGALPGFLLPTGAITNYLQGQYVGNSLFFYGDGYVRVQNHSLIDITDGDLSVDAWVMQDGNLPPGVHVITDKRLQDSSGVVWGYHMFLEGDGTGNARIGFQLADGIPNSNGSTHSNWVSAPIPNFYSWHHIAVTVNRGDPSGGRFYYDGQAVGLPFNPTSRQGSLSNSSPFTVAARSTSPSGFYVGGIDEVEVFRRALDETEVKAIFNAKAAGKCKQFCQVPRTFIFCKGAVSTSVEAHVVNFTPAGGMFGGSFDQLLCPYTPPNFPVTTSVPINPWSWDVASASAIGPDMGPFGGADTCFLASFTPPTPGAPSFSCDGVIVYRPDLECSSGSDTFLTLPLGSTVPAALGFGNAQIESGHFAYRVEAIGPDGMPSRTLSINGAQPGAALEGQASIPIGSEFMLTLDVRFDDVDALGFTTLLLSTDTDGSGNFVPAASAALMCEVSPDIQCPADFDGSGFVDTDDFDVFVHAFEAGSENADFDGTGFIDLDDFITFVQAFEAGC